MRLMKLEELKLSILSLADEVKKIKNRVIVRRNCGYTELGLDCEVFGLVCLG